MDYSRFFFGDGDDHHHLHHHHHHHNHHNHHQQQQHPQPSPRKELRLQGPRPAPLRVSKDSHAIRKPPRHPPPNPAIPVAKNPPPLLPTEDPRQPVIIYAVSPKVIHVEESDFMSLVQRLTGLSPSGPRTGDVSPAARFASIEKASPKHRPITGLDSLVGGDRATTATSSTTVEGFDLAVAGRGSVPGILSPAPSSLPAIPNWFFLPPAKDWPAVPQFEDLVMSPLLLGGGGTGSGYFGAGGGSIVSSPSAWFSSSMISPSPTSLDLYNLLADF